MNLRAAGAASASRRNFARRRGRRNCGLRFHSLPRRNSAAVRSLIEVNDVHFGLLANELAGVHEGAVPPASQAICCADPFVAVFTEIDAVILRKERRWRSSGMRRANRATLGVNGCQFGSETHPCFPIGKYIAKPWPMRTSHSRSGNIACT